jgi:hypothetical protein
MQNVNVVSTNITEFYVLSNSALVSAVILILCTGKWIKPFTKNVRAFNLHCKHIGLNLQENKMHHSKERKTLK